MVKKTGRTKKLSGYERFMALSDEERERLWESLNREIPLSETRPLSARMRREWELAKARKPGRPPTGEGAKPVYVTIERGLLRRADAYAKSQGMTRAQLVAKGLASVLPPKNGRKRKSA